MQEAFLPPHVLIGVKHLVLLLRLVLDSVEVCAAPETLDSSDPIVYVCLVLMLLPSLQLIVDLLSLLLDEQSLHIVVLLLVVRTTRACGRCVGARLHRALAHCIIVN